MLVRYGHRAIAEIDLGLPRWSEDPSHLLGAIANYQRLDAAALTPDAQFASGAREAQATIATLLSRVHGPRRLLARMLLRRVRALAGAREAPKFHAVRVFAQGRAILAGVGVALAAEGRVATADADEARGRLGGPRLRAHSWHKAQDARPRRSDRDEGPANPAQVRTRARSRGEGAAVPGLAERPPRSPRRVREAGDSALLPERPPPHVRHLAARCRNTSAPHRPSHGPRRQQDGGAGLRAPGASHARETHRESDGEHFSKCSADRARFGGLGGQIGRSPQRVFE